MAFHLYDINELYSNADGSIQFIELKVGNFNGENFWQGQTITVAHLGATTHSFSFPSNLPSNTANTSVLIATQGFADLGIVVPNYIVPSGFLFIDGGTVNFAGGFDIVVYAALPTNGTLSINRSGATGVNSPTNFAGATGTVPAPTPVNHPPTLVNALADQTATEDTAFSFTVAANAFADGDAGDTLTYGATKSDGTALPAWLAFNASTRTFSGTPTNAEVGGLDIRVSATDSANASVSDAFTITVANTNDAPTLVNALADQTATEDTAFSATVAANVFVDADAGDTLTYSATKSDGAALPTWLAFNASTMTFSGTPGTSDGGTINVKVTAIDAGGASATDVFALTSTPVTVGVQTYVWKSHMLLNGVETTLGGGSPATTDASGAASFAGVTGTSTTLTASRAIPTAEADATSAAANLQDAIAILKMIVGLDVNGAGKALSPYQALAADYDANGSVQLTDAIAVLKHVVGLSAPEPSWFFLNEADLTVPGKAGLTPGTVASSIDASVESHVGLVGVLRGDVDGSYAGPTGATDLDVTNTTYFTDLVASHTELSLSQFGIYPSI